MKHHRWTLALAAATIALAGCNADKAGEGNAATPNGEQGGKTIAAGASGKFLDALKAAGLDQTLTGPGPYTVLAPTDAAFDKLPAGALDTLMKPEGKGDLTKLLTYHVLPGTILAADIDKAITAGGGKTELPTMNGGMLTATKEGGKIVITDSAGTKATVGDADGKYDNGVVHSIDAVLMPK